MGADTTAGRSRRPRETDLPQRPLSASVMEQDRAQPQPDTQDWSAFFALVARGRADDSDTLPPPDHP